MVFLVKGLTVLAKYRVHRRGCILLAWQKEKPPDTLNHVKSLIRNNESATWVGYSSEKVRA